jgi:hypothetical protein
VVDELEIYGWKDSIFKNICGRIQDIGGRYHVSPNYGYDLNTANLMRFMKDSAYGLQDEQQKYPICVCITPRSSLIKINGYLWEQFTFSLFFLERTGYQNVNEVRDKDIDTQLTQDEEINNWSRMKFAAVSFISMFEKNVQANTAYETGMPFLQRSIGDDYEKVNIRRISNFGVDRVTGVELLFGFYSYLDECLEPTQYNTNAV